MDVYVKDVSMTIPCTHEDVVFPLGRTFYSYTSFSPSRERREAASAFSHERVADGNGVKSPLSLESRSSLTAAPPGPPPPSHGAYPW